MAMLAQEHPTQPSNEPSSVHAAAGTRLTRTEDRRAAAQPARSNPLARPLVRVDMQTLCRSAGSPLRASVSCGSGVTHSPARSGRQARLRSPHAASSGAPIQSRQAWSASITPRGDGDEVASPGAVPPTGTAAAVLPTSTAAAELLSSGAEAAELPSEMRAVHGSADLAVRVALAQPATSHGKASAAGAGSVRPASPSPPGDSAATEQLPQLPPHMLAHAAAVKLEDCGPMTSSPSHAALQQELAEGAAQPTPLSSGRVLKNSASSELAVDQGLAASPSATVLDEGQEELAQHTHASVGAREVMSRKQSEESEALATVLHAAEGRCAARCSTRLGTRCNWTCVTPQKSRHSASPPVLRMYSARFHFWALPLYVSGCIVLMRWRRRDALYIYFVKHFVESTLKRALHATGSLSGPTES